MYASKGSPRPAESYKRVEVTHGEVDAAQHVQPDREAVASNRMIIDDLEM